MPATSFLCRTPSPSLHLNKPNLAVRNPFQNRTRISFVPRAAATTSSPAGTAAAASGSSNSVNLYEVLGVPTTASAYEIKRAYRNLARVCHPDVVGEEEKDGSAAVFMRIHSAYLTLCDDRKRAAYDRELLLRSLRSEMVVSGGVRGSGSRSRFSGYAATRNWETDQCW